MAYLVTLCCVLIHISLSGADCTPFTLCLAKSGTIIYLTCCKAVSYSLYPLLGWMADVYFTRYKFMLYIAK